MEGFGNHQKRSTEETLSDGLLLELVHPAVEEPIQLRHR
jgi:hypothetical protein